MGTNDVTALEALKALAPLIGAGGISGIIIAIFAYLKAAREGRQGEPEKAGLGISALLADSSAINQLAADIRRGSDAFEKNAAALAALGMGFAESRPLMAKVLRDFVEEQGDFRKDVIEELRGIRHALEELGRATSRR